MRQFVQLKEKPDIRVIGFLYFFLVAGGTWHVLGWFQTLMRWLAAPLLIGLALLVLWFVSRSEDESKIPTDRMRLHGWAIFVLIVSFIIEWIGVRTGRIFGHYHYGEILQPMLYGVPLAIGFAWLCMLLTSVAVFQRLSPKALQSNAVTFASGAAVFMVLFDFIMEPAATVLNYWNWKDGLIPVQNYIAWYVISFLFVIFGRSLGLFRKKLPLIAFHAYFAQLIYFALVILKF